MTYVIQYCDDLDVYRFLCTETHKERVVFPDDLFWTRATVQIREFRDKARANPGTEVEWELKP